MPTDPLSAESHDLDPLLPESLAHTAERIGMRKAHAGPMRTLVLAILAGAFIALGAVFSTTVAAGSAALPFGVARLLIGLSFSLGLVLVVTSGAELFTGNNLIAMAWAGGKVGTAALVRNWALVYLGNFLGALGTAVLVFVGGHHHGGGGATGNAALSIAAGKLDLELPAALALGILCNALVCLAVWMNYGARSTVDKFVAVVLPVTAFVAAGFEHSVANMYFIPAALLIRYADPAFAADSGVPLGSLTWENFLLVNLLPVTLGNILGGVVLVALVYWFVYLRGPGAASSPPGDPSP